MPPCTTTYSPRHIHWGQSLSSRNIYLTRLLPDVRDPVRMRPNVDLAGRDGDLEHRGRDLARIHPFRLNADLALETPDYARSLPNIFTTPLESIVKFGPCRTFDISVAPDNKKMLHMIVPIEVSPNKMLVL